MSLATGNAPIKPKDSTVEPKAFAACDSPS
jgi:hypothetical protein